MTLAFNRKAILIVVIALSVTACTNRLAYNTLPFWINYYLSDFVELDSAQQARFDSALDRFHDWHREQELTELNALLSNIEKDASTPLSYQKIGVYHLKVNDRIYAMLQGLTPAFAELLPTLSDQQANGLISNLKKEIDLAIERANDGDSQMQIERRRSRLIESAEFWVDDIDQEQRSLFDEMAGYQIAMRPVFYAMRDDLFSQLEALLAQRKEPDLIKRLNAFWYQAVYFETEIYQKEMALYFARRYELLQRIDKHLNPEQRNSFRETLQSLQQDVQKLMTD